MTVDITTLAKTAIYLPHEHLQQKKQLSRWAIAARRICHGNSVCLPVCLSHS